MTREEALKTARALWGEHAFAEYRGKICVIGTCSNIYGEVPTVNIYGHGTSFVAAFQDFNMQGDYEKIRLEEAKLDAIDKKLLYEDPRVCRIRNQVLRSTTRWGRFLNWLLG